MRHRMLAAVAMAALAAPAMAQEAGFAALIRDVNGKVPAPERTAIEPDALAVLQADARASAQCVPTGVALGIIAPVTADRIASASVQAGKLRNMWLADATPSGCADRTTVRLMVFALPDARLRVATLNRGAAISWPSLMRDTLPQAAIVAVQAIRARQAGCDEQAPALVASRIATTDIDLSPDFFGVRYRGGWREIWTIRVCGVLADVPVGFKADEAGGAYTSISQKDVTLPPR